MKRFSFESNQPMHIYDDKTGAWYDPNAPRTVSELVDIANELSAERDKFLKLLQAVHYDKPSMRSKVRKQIRVALQIENQLEDDENNINESTKSIEIMKEVEEQIGDAMSHLELGTDINEVVSMLGETQLLARSVSS